LPLSARHLALFQAALDDAIAAAWHFKGTAARPGAVALDAAINAPSQSNSRPASPSDYAAAATAAAGVLEYLFPARATHFSAKAEEAIQTRLLAGVEYPSDVEAGRMIGRKIAALAIGRGKSDGSDAKWTGSIPEGPGKWKGVNPIAPAAGTWQPWVLANAAEFRPSAPPASDSEQVKAALNELKTFPRTPKSNHRAIFWEVNGGARAHTLWNEIARMKLLENEQAPAVASRVLAAVNIALLDAGIACWDAKYAFWYVRPSQLDPELKTLFAPPNHPSYPAAHGCFSTAAATVLASVFPSDRERLLALSKEAAEARVWAGIHYRFDIDAGQELGRRVAEKTLERAFVNRTH
jgi:membrane-associated phospholipid phosphatase